MVLSREGLALDQTIPCEILTLTTTLNHDGGGNNRKALAPHLHNLTLLAGYSTLHSAVQEPSGNLICPNGRLPLQEPSVLFMNLKDYIRDIPDFPQPGILFRDITPLLRNAEAFNYSVDQLAQRCETLAIDAIVAIESRGFLFGAPLACRLSKPLIPVRKEGKLPGETVSAEYYLEYGSNTVEMHRGDVGQGDKVIIIDDLLATGGTLAAAARLVEESGGQVSGMGLVIELEFLGGRNTLGAYDIFSLIQY